jgi:hypothetical protein
MLMRNTETLPTGSFTAIKRKMDNDYTNNISLWSIYWTQGNIAVRAESGDESIMAQLGTNYATNGRGSYYFNRIRPIGNMISGYQRRNRKSSIVVPLENGDDQTADQYSKILLNIFKKENVYETISEAFHQGAIISGLNLLQVYLDFTRDPLNGDIKVANLAYNQFMIDPYFREPDLSDCSFIWKRSFLPHAAVAALLPADDYDRVMSLQGNPTGMARDGRFQYMPESFGYVQSNKLSYDEYFYRDYRNAIFIVDRMSGMTMEIESEDDYDMKAMTEENPSLMVQKKIVPTVRMAIQVQDEIMYDGPNPLSLDQYPFIPIIGFYNKQMPYMYSRLQGVVRSLIDPQILFNRRIVLSADLCESVVNTGWIFKENALVDVKHLFQTGQGRIIPLKDDAQMTDIQPIQPPQIPPSFFQLQETFDAEMYNCAGLSQENLGKIVQDDASGYLSAIRQGAGLTAQQPIFDRLDLSQNMLGNVMLEIIQRNYTPGKVRMILEGQEPTQQFYNRAFGKYHSQVQLGFNTESQIQMEFAQKMELRKIGVPISDADMIESATLQGKDKIIQNMQKQQQQAMQMQQMQMQNQMQLQQAQTELAQARAQADMGLANERNSRVEENRALAIKQLHESNKEDELAVLNKVKALREIEGMDMDYLHKLVSIHNMLKASEVNQAQQPNQ